MKNQQLTNRETLNKIFSAKDAQINMLVDILKNKKVISEKEAKFIKALEPFPQLSL